MKRRIPAAVAAASIASVPVTLPASNAAAFGALMIPATWITASLSVTSRSSASRSSRLPSIHSTPVRGLLRAPRQRSNLMPTFDCKGY